MVCNPAVNNRTPQAASGTDFGAAMLAGVQSVALSSRASGQRPTVREMRRGAGAVERGGLENRCTLTGTEGSNPSLSAKPAGARSAIERPVGGR